jgi:hypothetical protein
MKTAACQGCPDIFELECGDFAIIGINITQAATAHLPASAGVGSCGKPGGSSNFGSGRAVCESFGASLEQRPGSDKAGHVCSPRGLAGQHTALFLKAYPQIDLGTEQDIPRF